MEATSIRQAEAGISTPGVLSASYQSAESHPLEVTDTKAESVQEPTMTMVEALRQNAQKCEGNHHEVSHYIQLLERHPDFVRQYPVTKFLGCGKERVIFKLAEPDKVIVIRHGSLPKDHGYRPGDARILDKQELSMELPPERAGDRIIIDTFKMTCYTTAQLTYNLELREMRQFEREVLMVNGRCFNDPGVDQVGRYLGTTDIPGYKFGETYLSDHGAADERWYGPPAEEPQVPAVYDP